MVDDGQRLPTHFERKMAIRNKWSSRKPKSTLLKPNSQEEKEMLLFVTKYQPFFTKNNLRIQKEVRVGVSLCVQLTSLHYFLWCPVINRETKFAFAIKAWWFYRYYIGKQRWNKLSCCIMKFKFNQMMHFYKFYTFYRDQSLETEWNA